MEGRQGPISARGKYISLPEVLSEDLGGPYQWKRGPEIERSKLVSFPKGPYGLYPTFILNLSRERSVPFWRHKWETWLFLVRNRLGKSPSSNCGTYDKVDDGDWWGKVGNTLSFTKYNIKFSTYFEQLQHRQENAEEPYKPLESF